MTTKRPSIKSPCVADRHAGPDERIAEVSFPDGTGCLISLHVCIDGRKQINIYRADKGIEVTVTSDNHDVRIPASRRKARVVRVTT